MKKRIPLPVLLALAMLGIVASCKKDKKDDFDRKALLTNLSDNVIIPAYTDLAAKLANLQVSTANFCTTPDSNKLTALKNSYVDANKSYQHCALYNFGPAKDHNLKATFNTFPADTTVIESNITQGSYDLSSSSNAASIGFPAIDYLLYAKTESDLITLFTSDANAQSRKNYLTDLISKMKSEFQIVLDQWNSSYSTTFIAADGNDVASSCSYLLNEFVVELELLKNAKIGIPSGELTGGQSFPKYVEGYYSGLSSSFAYENLIGLENCFTGGSGTGFDDYIRDVEGSDVSTSLADNILNQFVLCKSKANAISGNLSDAIVSGSPAVSEFFQEIKKLVIYCKADMTSLLGILITYQDSDGD